MMLSLVLIEIKVYVLLYMCINMKITKRLIKLCKKGFLLDYHSGWNYVHLMTLMTGLVKQGRYLV